MSRTDLISDALRGDITSEQPRQERERQEQAGTGAEEGYAVVEGDAAVEAIIAECLRRFPEARKLDAEQLSECLAAAIKDVRSRTAWRAWMRAANRAYRWGALGYSAFQIYSNPWIYRAFALAATLAMRRKV